MSSKFIYNHTPYFYIIRHITSDKMYAGSRWTKGCHPDEFMKINGYTTSSKIINQIIENEGIDSFEILRIDTNCDGLHVYEYETIFLSAHNCSKCIKWYNLHNNDGSPAYGTPEFKKLMKIKYGDENYNNQEKIKSTCMERYNVDHPNKRESEKQRLSETAKRLNDRPDMIQMLYDRNHSNDNPFKKPENIEKASERIRQYSIQAYKTGNHPMQKQSNKDAASARMKQTMANLPELTCPYCGFVGKGSNMIRWHFDKCKFKDQNYHKQ